MTGGAGRADAGRADAGPDRAGTGTAGGPGAAAGLPGLPGLPGRLDEVLDLAAREAPAGEAVVGADGRARYAELREAAVAVAGRLRAAGVSPSDRVVVLLPNGLRWVEAVLGAHHAGAVAMPLSTLYRPAELGSVLKLAEAAAVIAQPELFGVDVARVVADVEAATGRRLPVLWWGAGAPLPAPAGHGARPGPADRAGAADPAGPTGDLAFVLVTSGSTGRPKLVPLRHRDLVGNGWAIGRRQRLRPGDRLWLAAPLFFSYGCANALPAVLTHRATLCVQERFQPERAIEFIQRERCTVYYSVANQTNRIVESAGWRRGLLPTLRTGTAGSAPRSLIIEELGVEGICSAYGLTEAYGHSTMTAADSPRRDTLESEGWVLPTQRLRIVGPDGRPVPTDEVGEIQLAGAVAPGYLEPGGGLDTSPVTADGWFRTGDLGRVDGRGRLHFVARADDLLKIRGVRVAPAEIEAALVALPGVAEAYAVAVPAAGGHPVLAAAVVAADPAQAAAGAREAFASRLRDQLRARVAPYKVPELVEVLRAGEIPVTATGKPSRRLIRARFQPAGGGDRGPGAPGAAAGGAP